jgi:hypothetical protein
LEFLILNMLPASSKKIIQLVPGILLFLFSSPSKSQYYETLPIEKSRYVVYFKGQRTEVTAKYKKVFGKKLYFLKTDDNKNIHPEETDSVFRVFGYGNRDTLKGIKYKKNWLFLTQNGDIKGYSRRPVPLIYACSYYKADSLFVRNDKRFRKAYLGKWVAGSSRAEELWKKQRRRHIGKAIVAPLIFTTCIALSIVVQPGSAFSNIAWVSSIPLSIIPLVFKKIETADIIDAYNSSKKMERNNFFKDE